MAGYASNTTESDLIVMKLKETKVSKRYLTGLMLLLLWLPAAAVAAKPPSVTLVMDGREERILLTRAENAWTVMLPSGVDGAMLHDGQAVALAGMTEGAVSFDTRVSASVNGKQTVLRLLPSANIGSVFIDLDQMKLSQFGDSKRRKDSGRYRLYNTQSLLDSEGIITEFSLHGNSTLKAKKKSFNLKLDRKRSLLGMEADRSWTLISNAYDNSFARNYTALTLAKDIGMPFVPDMEPVDVYLNGEYLGAYLLSEKVQIGKGRVEIRDLKDATEDENDQPLESYKMLGSKTPVKGQGKYYDIPVEPADITGGYLMELDLEARYEQLTSAYVTERGQIISIRSPKYLSKAQYGYISGLLQTFENALFNEEGIDPVSGKRFEEIVDLDSAVLKYMFEELVCNFDANKTSQFFYKDTDQKDQKLHFGPPWDYDISLANRSGEDGIEFIDPEALAVGVQVRMKLPVYYRQLAQLPQVRNRLAGLFQEAGIHRTVEALTGRRDDGTESIQGWTDRTE